MTAGAFTATLKGKINGLEETIKALKRGKKATLVDYLPICKDKIEERHLC